MGCLAPALRGAAGSSKGKRRVRQTPLHQPHLRLDLEKFFDRVNHDVLMARVARKVKDKRVLRRSAATYSPG